MRDNVNKIKERGDKLEDLEKKGEKLQRQSMMFQKSAQRVKNKTMWENNKIKIAIAGAGALVIIIIIIWIAS